jgi:UDP-2-acetamido-3-amino-2,3-dideoxy-glucuronate N-acetyltransferase
VSNVPAVAVVGCGYWGRNLVRNFGQLGALRAVCDANADTLARLPLEPGVRRVARFDEILADQTIDAVVLATPAAMHADQARQAIEHGKHLFVEKPLALRFSDGVEIVRRAETRGRVLMVGHILEYHPAVALLKRLVHDGELGRIWYIYSNRLNLGKVRQEENILWSFAPHDLSVITSLTNAEPVSVSAIGSNYLQDGIADVTITNLAFANGVNAHIFVSWLHPYKEQRLVIIGDRKMAVLDDTVREGKVRIYDKGIDWKDGVPVPRRTSETTLFPEEVEPLRIECAHFLDCVRNGRTPLTNGANALTVLRLLEASQLSLDRGGVPVLLASIGELPATGMAGATREPRP